MPVIKYSIIVPCYNVSEYVDDCLQSLTSLTYDPNAYEIITVDDGSTDETMEHLKQWETNYKNIKVFQSEHKWGGGARNLGISNAQGEWIMFVDSDDWINTSNILEIFDKIITPEIEAIKTTKYHASSNREDTLGSLKEFRDSPQIYAGEELLKAGKFMPHIWLGCYRRSLVKRMNYPFREGVCFEDTDWSAMMYIKAKSIATIDLPFYTYYNRLGSVSNTPSIKRYEDGLNGTIYMKKMINLDMSETSRDFLINNLKSNILRCIWLTKNYPVKDSLRVFKTAKINGLFDLIGFRLNKSEKIKHFFITNTYSFIIPTLRYLTLLKRKISL